MAKRQERALLERRDLEELDTSELLQLTKDETLLELRKMKDAHGSEVQRLEEEYNGIPVYDSIVTVRTDDMGQLTGDAAGTLIQGIDEDLPDTTPKLTDEETLNIAIKYAGDELLMDAIGDVNYKRFVFLDENETARLVNQVSYLIDGKKKPIYIIDLNSGEILRQWNSFKTKACTQEWLKTADIYGGNKKMGKIKYGSQPNCLDFTVDDFGKCYLENKYVRVVDMKQSENESITETASFLCSQVYNDSINGAYSPAIDAFHHATVVGKMFEEWYNTTALKNRIVIRVHYGENLDNAFWNGMNASFGDADGTTSHPLTSMDVVGHEIGHGVIEYGSNLEYRGESGGLDEAFSDILGEMAEEYYQSSDLMTGKDIALDAPYIREFENPEKDGSISNADEMEKSMDPHGSSGVYRKVWYLLVKDLKMMPQEAFRVFLYANKMYWHYVSSFYDASCGLLRSAMDLGIDTKPFAMAFEGVGIKACNVSAHIFTLTNNKTQGGVTVSQQVSPVFGFTFKASHRLDLGKRFFINAFTNYGGPIPITVYNTTNGQNELDESDLITSGSNNLVYRFSDLQENFRDTHLLIRLGPTEYDYFDDVEVTTGALLDV